MEKYAPPSYRSVIACEGVNNLSSILQSLSYSLAIGDTSVRHAHPTQTTLAPHRTTPPNGGAWAQHKRGVRFFVGSLGRWLRLHYRAWQSASQPQLRDAGAALYLVAGAPGAQCSLAADAANTPRTLR
eukprot:TRINITY_DN5447_c0_g1_i1.p1 TRINITY_DN5447_c0_g1~~TRINITY_DN5447_c0_g1_i1.p1  ORF type:complete len:128 (+),score=33.81 TRINITY_DN5447_c0_g1_i1:74-457(+)